MNIEVTKYNFYENVKGPHLKYIESTKKQEVCDHFQCNCTKVVSEKPKTRLTSSQISIDAFLKRGKYDIEINLMNGHYTFRYDDNHSYFWMKYSGGYGPWKDRGIKIEIFKEGATSVDYLFADMYLGYYVNTSRLMNGHAPSRIIDLPSIKSDDIWLHGCHWGNESVKTISNHEESDMWRRVIETSTNIVDSTSKFRPEAEYTVEEIKEKMLSHKHLEEAIDFCVDYFINVIENLETTEFYKLATEIRSEIELENV